MFEEKNQTVSAKIKNPEKGHGWSTGLVHGFCLRAYGFSFAHIKHEALPYGLRAYENSIVFVFFFRRACQNPSGVSDFGALAI